jgi:hypothetical protein
MDPAEAYIEERNRTETAIDQQVELRGKDWVDKSQTWRMRTNVAVEMGILELHWHQREEAFELIRHKPWARLKLRETGISQRRGTREVHYTVLEIEPRYMADQINADPLIKEALIKIADDRDLNGGARHFGGTISRPLREGGPLTVAVWTD